MPKIELHAHLSGSVRALTFMELAEKKGIDIDHIDFYNMTMDTGFEIFMILSKIIDSLDVVYRITREIIDDYAK